MTSPPEPRPVRAARSATSTARPGRRVCGIAAVAAAAMIAACASPGAAYYDAQRAWTVDEEAYEGFETRAFVHATLKTEPFRRAYADEYARLYDLNGAQRDALLAAELEEARHAHVVVTAFYTPQLAWNDLNPARELWEVRIEGPDGRAARPDKVRRLDQRNPLYPTLYPYVMSQYTLYELIFPREADDGSPIAASGEPLTLVIAGPPTRIRLSWVLP